MSVIVKRTRRGWIDEHAGVGLARAEEAPLAFDEMFTRYNGRIYGYLLGMVGDTEQAQDLTQDAFLTIPTINRAKVCRHVQKRGVAATKQIGDMQWSPRRGERRPIRCEKDRTDAAHTIQRFVRRCRSRHLSVAGLARAFAREARPTRASRRDAD